jgi:hypothetical protein
MKTSQPKTTVKVDIEALLAKKSQITSAAINGALAKLEARKQEEQEAQLLEYLEVVSNNTQSAVNALRKARDTEKIYKKRLEAIAAAEQQFYKDADIKAYNAAFYTAQTLV